MSWHRRCCSALAGTATLLLTSVASAQPAVDAAAIDAVFARFDKPTVPGCALGLYRDGRIVYERGYGSANLDHAVPILPDTVFYAGSVSKQFTAFAAALLIEQRKLALADSLRQFFPELPQWADAITVDDLIHHTSGIRDHLTLWEISGRTFADEFSAEEAIDLIARQRGVDFQPGTRWSYTNSGYFLLAEIVGRTTGTPFSRFAHDAIFAPLDMTSTHFHDDNSRIVPRRAAGYLPDGAGGFRVVTTTFALVGSGGLFTTVRDLVKWDENFYDNRLGGGAALIETITTAGRLANGEPHIYAFGLVPGAYRGLPMIQHGGSFPGFSAHLIRFPTEHVSIAVLCNDVSANAQGLAQRVADSYLAGRLEAPPVPPARPTPQTNSSAPPVEMAPAELRRFVGRYLLQPGLVASVVELDDGLRLRITGQQEQRIVPSSATTFVFPAQPGREIEFVGDGENVSLWAKATPFPPAPKLVLPDLSAVDLAEYSGRYTSAELDTWFVIRAAESGLEVRMRYGPWVRLELIGADRFVVGPTELRFERDGNSEPTSFVVLTQRASNIKFERGADAAAR